MAADGFAPKDLRIGDRERDQVTQALHDAFAQGRITREELDERLETTLTARTAGDLKTVLSDLVAPDDPANPVFPRREPYAYRGDLATWGHHYAHHHAIHQGIHHGIHQARAQRHAERRAHWEAQRQSGRRSGRPPFLPMILAFALVVGIATGSIFVVFKVALVIWLGAMVFGIARHRRSHH
ncbi:hypothetical protein Aple_102440 [Acrocarpospora pleiomorpha]|uniref:DUF1707 domain-containing protein n=1 Tax=Acrocarpospora pleiomorpha TaxID=90975 RepID=A0A5M3Y208_9ACTN|nr:DUF1707 domain-containing protein [Acrocarpospora pleiomorpha]GES27344.1 hypothetical protein Aple_102440 [Acrocarpospora pleiomorpha]